MANQLFDFKVTGARELAKNLADFGSPKTMNKLIGLSMRAGALIPLRQARVNARSLGLGFIGFQRRRSATGGSQGQERRYGRIPASLKANRLYAPRGSQNSMFRMNIIARTQRGRGIYRNKAPHAHLIEYGWRHYLSGHRIPGRPFLGPALTQTAPQVVATIASHMSKLIDGLTFPTTGNGP